MQVPPEQAEPAPHTTSAQGSTQAPLWQLWPSGQGWPLLPQVSSTQPLAWHLKPSGQVFSSTEQPVGTQVPLRQLWPMGQMASLSATPSQSLSLPSHSSLPGSTSCWQEPQRLL